MSLLSRKPGEARRRGTPADLLVVGLGNPGADFAGTRHNVGADAVALLADRHGSGLSRGKSAPSTCEVRLSSKLVALAFPQTFMNNSGQSVRLLCRRFGIEDASQLVVIHDELDLDVGRLKLKQGGGLAGHNGLRSITQHLGTTDYVRLRIGVGRPPSSQAGRDFVLRRPGKKERVDLDVAIAAASDAVELFVESGIDVAMNSVNRRPE